MRKFIITFLLLMSVGAYAQQISVEQAKKSAIEFLTKVRQSDNSPRVKMRTGTPKLSLAYTAKQDGDVQFYVFNDSEGGFIVSGGDERAEEILAYAEDGNFNIKTANPNLKYWLGMFQKEISNGQRAGLDGIKDDDRSKSKLAAKTASRVDVPILVSTRWDQEAPYHNAIKAETGYNYYTGCVATAMSQVMNFYKWPVTGIGSHTYYDSSFSKRSYSRNFSEHQYDWPHMRDEYKNGVYSDPQAAAVAELMFDAGVSVNMQYSRYGSAAYTEYVPYSLVNFFGYDRGVGHRYREYYSNEEWDELLYEELAAGRPVMYGGISDEEGHSFICDGYNAATGTFHFNWGWSGDGDCYCSLSAVKMDNILFKYYQDMVYGIQKPCGGKAKPNIILYDDCYLESSKTEKDGYATYKLTFGDFPEDDYASFIWNDSYIACDVVFNMKYVNQETGKEYVASLKNASANKIDFTGMIVGDEIFDGYYGYDGLTVSDVKIPKMPAGEYRVYLVYKEWADIDDESVEWTTVRSFTTENNYFIETVESTVPTPEAFDATDVTGDSFVAHWSAVEGADSYSVSITSAEKEGVDVVALDEDFAVFDNQTSVGISDIGSKMDAYMSEPGWTGKKVYTAPSSVKLGTTQEGGVLSTPMLKADGKVVVVVGEKPYSTTENTEVTVEFGDTKVTFPAENTQHIIEADVYGDFNVTISTNGGKQRAYITNVSVTVDTRYKSNTVIYGIKGTEYLFEDLNAEYDYVYKVRAYVGEEPSKWSNEISVSLNDSPIVPTDTCAAPQIAYEDGVLSFKTSTEGAKCYYTLVDSDVKNNFTVAERDVKIGVTYVISAFATKEGWANSDTVIAVISWLEKLPEPITDVLEVKATPVIVQNEGENLAVRGLPDGIEVSAYNVSGMLLGKAISMNSVAYIPIERKKNDVIIIKIGDNAIKYVMK